MNAPRATKHKLQLISFCLWKSRKDGTVEVRGGTDSRYEGDRLQILAGHVPHRGEDPAKNVPPFAGLIAIHGSAESVNEMRYWRLLAHQEGSNVALVNYSLEVGELYRGAHSLASIEDGSSRVFSLRRSSIEVQQRALSYVVEKEGGAVEGQTIAMLARKPALLIDWMLNDPIMAKVDVGIFPVADDPKSPLNFRQLVFVRTGVTVAEQFQAQPNVDLFLPSWLTDKKLARKLASQATG
jgi:hypothetical protein